LPGFGECPWRVYPGAGGKNSGRRRERWSEKAEKERRREGESRAERGVKGMSDDGDGDGVVMLH